MTAARSPFSRRSALALGTAAFGAALLPAVARGQVQTLPLAGAVGLDPVDVTVAPATYLGRPATRVRLTPARQKAAMAPNAGNAPTMALVPGAFGDGAIEVDIAAEVNGLGAADARAFAGIAFRVAGRGEKFEAVYLRMANGTLADPPPPAPRNVRAVQYIAHPDFHFDVSRRVAPGVYEKAAPVAPKRWLRFRLVVAGARAEAFVDGTSVLTVPDLKLGAGARGPVGLFVDDGTDGFFANLRIERK